MIWLLFYYFFDIKGEICHSFSNNFDEKEKSIVLILLDSRAKQFPYPYLRADLHWEYLLDFEPDWRVLQYHHDLCTCLLVACA